MDRAHLTRTMEAAQPTEEDLVHQHGILEQERQQQAASMPLQPDPEPQHTQEIEPQHMLQQHQEVEHRPGQPFPTVDHAVTTRQLPAIIIPRLPLPAACTMLGRRLMMFRLPG